MTSENDVKDLDVKPVARHRDAVEAVCDEVIEQGHDAMLCNTKAEEGLVSLVVISDFDRTYTVPSTDGGVHKVSVQTSLKKSQ